MAKKVSDLDEKKVSFTAEEVVDFFKEINLEALGNSLRLSIDDEKKIPNQKTLVRERTIKRYRKD